MILISFILGYKAYIIDFGRAQLQVDEKLLSKEYDDFCRNSGINEIKTGMKKNLKL